MDIAVLGLGSIGLRHAKNVLACGHGVIGVDPSAERRQSLVDAGGRTATDREEAISAADAVLIATPSEFHIDDLAAAIDAGKHVFMEKPLGHRIEGLRDILDRAAAKGLHIFAGMNLRVHPAVLKFHEMAQAGSVGDVLWVRAIVSSYLPSWRPHQNYRQGYAAKSGSGGIVLDAIHEIDLVSYLFGLPSLRAAVSRTSGVLEIASEDVADILLQHEAGFVSNIHMDYVTQPARRYLEVACTNGLFVLDLLARTFKHYDVDNAAVAHETFETDWNDDYSLEIRNFVDVVDGKDVDYCDGYEALKILDLALQARDR